MADDPRKPDPKKPNGGNGSGQVPDPSSTPPELIMFPGSRMQEQAGSLDHLSQHRRLIVRRSLLASAVGGLVPIPVMDDYLAGRIRAGMLMKLAERRQVDLAQSSADLLADPREETAVRNATLTAATLLALKLAWKKFFALLAVGRRAEDMATTFQMGTLFDHFCTKLHVGSGIDRVRAFQLRTVIHASLVEAERGAVVSVFRDGGQILGRSLLEAPEWVSKRFEKATEQWLRGGAQAGQPLPYDDTDDISPENARWLDRASTTVESGLGRLGTTYLESLIRIFERRWQEAETARKKAEEKAKSQTPTP